MKKSSKNNSKTPAQNSKPALTLEAEENEMISLAMQLVKKRLQEGTATSQETTHFLKLGSTRAQLERDKMAYENELIKSKIEEAKTAKNVEVLYQDAMAAFRGYAGMETQNEEDEDDEY